MGKKFDAASYLNGDGINVGLAGGHAFDLAKSGQSWDAVQNPFGSVAGGITLFGGGVSAGLSVAEFINSCKTRKSADSLVANSMLPKEQNAFGPSPHTYTFIKARSIKNMAGGVASGLSGGASVATLGINSLGVLKNGSSTITTSIHAEKLRRMRKKMPNHPVAQALDLILHMKRAKAVSRAVQTAADGTGLIPAASGVLGTASSVISTVVGASKETQCRVAAEVIHKAAYGFLRGLGTKKDTWKAFRGKGIEGVDAILIVRELLTQRSFSKAENIVKKRAKTYKYMAEPAGWMVVLDKIQSM